MSKEEILGKMADAVVNGDSDAAVKLSEEVIKAGVDPLEAIEKGLAKGLKIIGDKFDAGEVYLPECLLGVEAMEAGTAILKPKIPKERFEKARRGVVVIGTVEGDIHDIGKTLVATMLSAAGFEVHDLGRDVPPSEFIKRAEDLGADIIAASTLMTVTMESQKEIVDVLEELGIRDKFKIMVGGGPVTRAWKDEIRADGFGSDATDAVREAKKILKVEE